MAYACVMQEDTLPDMKRAVALARTADPVWNGDTCMLAAALLPRPVATAALNVPRTTDEKPGGRGAPNREEGHAPARPRPALSLRGSGGFFSLPQT